MIFKPQIWINSVLDIDEDFLDKYNIKALVLDLDNTLSMHGNPAAENGIPEWLEHMKNIGVPMRIVSNNTNKRVAPLAKKLGLPFTANGCKPLTFGISKVLHNRPRSSADGRYRRFCVHGSCHIFQQRHHPYGNVSCHPAGGPVRGGRRSAPPCPGPRASESPSPQIFQRQKG